MYSYVITPLSTHFIVDNGDMECRSRITDMAFNPRDTSLYVLACNGGSMLNIRDMIFRVPYNYNGCNSTVIVPSVTQEGFNLLKSITFYNNFNDYLVFGARANNPVVINQDSVINSGDLCFFDRITDTSRREMCGEKYNFDIIPTDYYYTEDDYPHLYNNIMHDTATYLILPAYNYGMTYNIPCIH